MFCQSIEKELENKVREYVLSEHGNGIGKKLPENMSCLSIEMELEKKAWAYVLFKHRNGI